MPVCVQYLQVKSGFVAITWSEIFFFLILMKTTILMSNPKQMGVTLMQSFVYEHSVWFAS